MSATREPGRAPVSAKVTAHSAALAWRSWKVNLRSSKSSATRSRSVLARFLNTSCSVRMCVALQVEEARHLSGREQYGTEVSWQGERRAEQPVEHGRALDVPVQRMVGGEADAGEHLLAVSGRDPARSTPNCL